MHVGSDLLNLVFGKEWSEKSQEIRDASPFGHLKGWRLASFIMKAGEDIRRESLVMQIIAKLQRWFEEEIPAEHRPYLRPYNIMCVGADAGIVECVTDAKSIDEIKKRTDHFISLRDYFIRSYGLPQPPKRRQQRPTTTPTTPFRPPHGIINFETAQDNFLRSLVGYSLVCYILQIKDRHNANILMDRMGHIMHIDYGFVLGDTPKMGKVPIFSERAPFKLSQEFWDVLGGWNVKHGGLGVKFCKMFEVAFACAANHADEIATLVELFMLLTLPTSSSSTYGAGSSNNVYELNHESSSRLQTARLSADRVRNRLRMRGPHRSKQQQAFIMELVNAALTSWGTTTYDWLQRNMNGYQ